MGRKRLSAGKQQDGMDMSPGAEAAKEGDAYLRAEAEKEWVDRHSGLRRPVTPTLPYFSGTSTQSRLTTMRQAGRGEAKSLDYDSEDIRTAADDC